MALSRRRRWGCRCVLVGVDGVVWAVWAKRVYGGDFCLTFEIQGVGLGWLAVSDTTLI